MSHSTILSDAVARRTQVWPLEVDVELCGDDRCEPTAEQLGSLAGMLNAAKGVSLAVVVARPRTRLVSVSLRVEAYDLYDAHDRACALVRDHVGRAGLAPAILVASRPAREPAHR